VRAASYLNQGRLDEAAAHLAVAGRHAETTPPGRRRRLQVAIASLKVSLARRRDHLAGVTRVVHGASQAAGHQPSLSAEEFSPDELRVLPHLPTNLSRPEIAGKLSVSLNTVSMHIRNIYAELQVRDRSLTVQRENCGC
jgi:ATP/maltotriose-dependent transcriptional regulator MalT